MADAFDISTLELPADSEIGALEGLKALGVDVAELGDDATVLAHFRGSTLYEVESIQGKRTDEISALIQVRMGERMISPEKVAENIARRVISLFNEDIPLFNIRKPYNIGEDPSSPRIAFPYDITSPLQVVEQGGIEHVASPGNGPCIITATTLYKTHSHAGGHADTPFHLGEEYEDVLFNDGQYTGSATVVDLSPYFAEGRS